MAKARHHYLAQFYLDYFTNQKGKLIIFDKWNSQFRPSTPRNEARINHYNTVELKDGSKSNTIEDFISEYEGKAADIYKKVFLKKQQIKDEQVVDFSFFLGLAQTRVPKFRRQLAKAYQKQIDNFKHDLTTKRFSELIKSVESKRGKKLSDRQAYKNFISDNVQIMVSRSQVVARYLGAAAKATEFIANKGWYIAEAAEDTSFITSDNPFFVIGRHLNIPVGVASPGTLIIFPLSPKLLFCARDNRELFFGYGKMPKDKVKIVNQEIARNSDKLLISHNEVLLRRIVKRATFSNKNISNC